MVNLGYESKYDWLIYRKFNEANVIYFIPARADNKSTRSLKTLIDLIESGRENRPINCHHN